VNPWRGSGPEITIAGTTYAVIAIAAYLVAGPEGLAVVTVVTAAIALAAVRLLLPNHKPEVTRKLRDKPAARSISGYSRRRYVVAHASETGGFYESEMRPVLEHILAARLAERHNTNFYTDQETARNLLGENLWYWVDPDKSTERVKRQRGIPPRTLARLIDRLERL
jgi:hypothetical protein